MEHVRARANGQHISLTLSTCTNSLNLPSLARPVLTPPSSRSYILVKHWSEVAILCLMLYILQSRFNAANRKNDSKHKYSKVPDVEPKVAAQAREGKKGKGGAKINPTGGELNV